MSGRFVSLFKSNFFKLAAFVILLGVSVLIGIAMMLGKEAGNFVIKVQDASAEKSIAITIGDPNDTTKHKSQLQARGLVGMTDYTGEYFIKNEDGYSDLNAMTAQTGEYTAHGNCLYAYTFYIVNTSASGNVGVNVSLKYSNVSNGVDNAIRCMTYARSNSVVTPRVYAKNPQNNEDSIDFLTINDFQHKETGSGTVFDDQTYIIGSTASDDVATKSLKYSVFFWLEGNDPDCTEKILGGTIKFTMDITIIS